MRFEGIFAITGEIPIGTVKTGGRPAAFPAIHRASPAKRKMILGSIERPEENPMRDFSRLTRAIQKMPAFVRSALAGARLTSAYRARPAYQQNDYLSWITRAKLPQTKQKRLEEMLDDLRRGDRYMGMRYRAAKKRKTG